MERTIIRFVSAATLVLGLGRASSGCLDRPVSPAEPSIKTNFTASVSQSGVDKVDILFDIDNSASMGDKQAYLIEAIPQMIARLVTPDCLGPDQAPTGATADPTTGACPAGSAPEFAAVHDMHIGVVTSSLGSRLGILSVDKETGAVTPVCDPMAPASKSATGVAVPNLNDDRGHLVNRTSPLVGGAGLAAASLPEGGGFLSWFPPLGNEGHVATTPPSASLTLSGADGDGGAGTLVGDFSELVGGAGESGCGIESQLESWYRFLIQPDPYLTIADVGGVATWQGVDTTILQQRHDFLRPDSLVVVVVLSDENDSEIDVRSYQGSGHVFMSNTYSPPRATTACASDPDNLTGKCASCQGCGTKSPPAAWICEDSNCQLSAAAFDSTDDGHDWGYDLNLRHVHMLQKYGLDPQFPLTRYSNGLTSPSVPNRVGEYPKPTGGYAGNNNCTNPLFASKLPVASDVADPTADTPPEIATTLCNLPAGTQRAPADVFFAHIGGVPHQLLQSTPGDGVCAAGTAPADCPQKDTLKGSDWEKILGKGPAAYTAAGGPIRHDYTGIDPHMIESMIPRNELGGSVPCDGGVCLGAIEPAPASAPAVTSLPGPGLVDAAADRVRPDPISGREWTTHAGTHSLGVDRQYACIFPLPAASQRDCAKLPGDSVEGASCDCDPGNVPGQPAWVEGGPPGPTGNTPDEIPPLCSTQSTDGTIVAQPGEYTVQTYAKAYPTVRELMLANMMGDQGIVSSLCPIHTEDNAQHDDPLYGYRPAVDAIVNRLRGALDTQCVPRLTYSGPQGDVPCLVLVTFGEGSGGPASSTECASYGNGAYSNVDPSVLSAFKEEQRAAAGDAGESLADYPTCALTEAPVPAGGTCTGGTKGGWCYVTGAGVSPGTSCSQQIAYSSAEVVPNHATISLQCISTSSVGGG